MKNSILKYRTGLGMRLGPASETESLCYSLDFLFELNSSTIVTKLGLILWCHGNRNGVSTNGTPDFIGMIQSSQTTYDRDQVKL